VNDVKNRKIKTLAEGADANYFKKPKSWILILGVAMNFIQFLRYFVTPSSLGNFVFNGSLYFCEAIKYAIFMVIFYYFLRKAASLMPKETVRRWERIIKVLTISATFVFLTFGIEYLIV